jgi:hypothetical protein
MHQATFTWDPDADEDGAGLRVSVDGRDLADVIAEVERPHAEAEGHPGMEGGYSGLPPSWLDEGLRAHYLGGPESHLASGPRDKTVLIGCPCGEPGCWPLMAQVEVTGQEVRWSDFEQPHRRGRWSYDDFGPLVFDRRQYEAALDAAGAPPE